MKVIILIVLYSIIMTVEIHSGMEDIRKVTMVALAVATIVFDYGDYYGISVSVLMIVFITGNIILIEGCKSVGDKRKR